ncbi:OFP transcription factor [Panicum miliaceum]|uniref:Transcription repressor n=1 Tax=Panicum miliaceum TaxID=4540 RepID=A0A3L6TKI6_PANMI|nr:OFP transcription factor [Panicum miliaceum]
MAKRLFHSCRSPSAAAAVTPTATLLRSERPPAVPAPAGGACCPRRGPLRRRQPQPPAACGAGGCAVDYGADDLPPARGTPAYRWLKSSRWHVVEAADAYASDGDGDDTPRAKIDARRRVRHPRRRRRRVLHRRAAGPGSWSSGEDSGWFSSDGDGDGDDGPFGAGSSSSALQVASTTTTESSSTGASGNSASAVACAAARPTEEAAAAVMAGGFAVVKRSDDPRGDFRRSMAEMVVGRGIYDADGLERLLRCFLALNDRRHRRDIVAAFGDVWEAILANPPPSHSHSHGAVHATSSHASSCKAAAATHP